MDEAGYDQFIEVEEDHWWFRARRDIFFHVLDRIVGGRGTLDVLDVGCGAGGLLAGLTRYGQAVGLEPHRGIAGEARARTGLPVLCGDALRLPFPAERFDLVCLFDTVEHIPDQRRALAEVRRVLRPGARAFLSVPAYEFLWTNNDEVAQHCRRYTRARLVRALREAGFEIERASYFNSLLLPAIVPALLLQKLRERTVGLRNPHHTNLTVPLPGVLADLLYRVMRSERHWLRRASLPAGHSLIAVARRAE